MKWDATLETGIPIVDEQHQSLFRQVEDLLNASKENRVDTMLSFLGDYVLMHFGTEEMMQRAAKYPRAAEHEKLHEAFVATLAKLKVEHAVGKASGNEMLVLIKITKLALTWLQDHIMGADKDFGDYFKASCLGRPAPSSPDAAPRCAAASVFPPPSRKKWEES
jgi:hemerythrin